MARTRSVNPGRHDFILRLTDQVNAMADPADVELRACTALAEHISADHVHYADYRLDQGLVIVGPEHTRTGMAPAAGRYGIADFRDPGDVVGMWRETLAVPDVSVSKL